MREALLIIDMLNDFVREGAPLEVPLTRAMLPALGKRLAEARNRGVPVIYIGDGQSRPALCLGEESELRYPETSFSGVRHVQETAVLCSHCRPGVSQLHQPDPR